MHALLCFSETRVEDEEDLYDCVYGEDEGGEVYEDLMKAEEAHQPVGLLFYSGYLTRTVITSRTN